jgi:NAD(P)-dependent dehydrogenase (short-subunit alcohol dehydrogenase family)
MPDVLVVTGVGGMGQAVARRLGGGRKVVLADVDDAALSRTCDALATNGYDVHAQCTDVSSERDVSALATAAASFGVVRAVVHTAGVSPVQATARQVIDIDVVGTARVLDAFEPHVQPGTVAVCIASMAGTMTELAPDVLRLLALTPADQLHTLGVLDASSMDSGTAYGLAKRANQARVEAASITWGRRGGRVVSISPGIISTGMGQAELSGPSGEFMRNMIAMSGTGRIGTPDDIAAAVEWLASPAASFVTGTDILVDGGAIASLRYATP